MPDPETVRAPATTPLASPQRSSRAAAVADDACQVRGPAGLRALEGGEAVAATPDAKPRRKV